MHDIKYIINNAEAFTIAMKNRGVVVDVEKIIDLDRNLRAAQTRIDYLRGVRNSIANKIGKLMATRSKFDPTGGAQKIIDDYREENESLDSEESIAIAQKQAAQIELNHIMERLPNIAADDVPVGGEEDNKLISSFRAQDYYLKKTKHHADMRGVSSELGHKIGKGRLTVLQGGIARLSRAITQYMLDSHIAFGYQEINAPVLVSAEALFGTGQLPKFEDDLFKTNNGYLAPTAEVMLTNLVNNDVLTGDQLPLRFVAQSQCFRLEAGSAGRDTRGILRQNQFEKVELVSIVEPENGEQELERMTWCAQQILEGLELPYRTVLLASKDMGFSARKTYDIEVWMAGEGVYREISSCSWCGDFQARRMNTRLKVGKSKVVPHTLNGSALAVGRTLAAVLEYYYDEAMDTIRIPEVLKTYLNADHITV